jgi:glycosyltransferase involved in cell wall biosynthesis
MVSRCFEPAIAYGGPVVKMSEMARFLADRDHEVVAVTTDLISTRARTGHRSVESPSRGVTVVRLRGYGRYRWETLIPGVHRQLDDLEPRADIMHIYGYRHQLGWSAACWAIAHGMPFLLEPEGSFEPSSRSIAKKVIFDKTLGRRQVDAAARVVAESPREGAEFSAFGVPAGKIAVLRDGADAMGARTFPKAQARSRLNLPQEIPLVAWLGRLIKQKDVPLLIRSVAALGDVGLVLAGPDEDGSAEGCRALAAELGIADRLWMMGVLDNDEKWTLFAAADCFALSSLKESFGIAAAEAMMAGVPVVVPDTAGVADAVTPDLGTIVPRDVGAFTSAQSAGRNNELLAPEGLRSLSWEARGEKLLATYEEILHRQ